MKPQPKARRNEPAFLPHILKAVARALGRDPGEWLLKQPECEGAFRSKVDA
jgi:hypothetical protein